MGLMGSTLDCSLLPCLLGQMAVPFSAIGKKFLIVRGLAYVLVSTNVHISQQYSYNFVCPDYPIVH